MEHRQGRSVRTSTGTWLLLAVVTGWSDAVADLNKAEKHAKGMGGHEWRHMLLTHEKQRSVSNDNDCLYVEGGDVALKIRERLELLLAYVRSCQPNLKLKVFE